MQILNWWYWHRALKDQSGAPDINYSDRKLYHDIGVEHSDLRWRGQRAAKKTMALEEKKTGSGNRHLNRKAVYWKHHSSVWQKCKWLGSQEARERPASNPSRSSSRKKLSGRGERILWIALVKPRVVTFNLHYKKHHPSFQVRNKLKRAKECPEWTTRLWLWYRRGRWLQMCPEWMTRPWLWCRRKKVATLQKCMP